MKNFVFADFLGKQLEDYVSQLPVPVHIERMGVRSGLIRARLRGDDCWCLELHLVIIQM